MTESLEQNINMNKKFRIINNNFTKFSKINDTISNLKPKLLLSILY